MCDFHITAWMRRAREKGRLPERTYMQLLEEHLQQVCPSCDQEYRMHAQGLSQERVETPEDWRNAAADLDTLLSLPREERIGTIQRARQRFQSPTLARLLVDRSFACLPHDPQESLEAARLALAVAEESGRDGMGEMHVLALGYHGNALRALGRLPEASVYFQRSRQLIRRGVVTGKSLEVIADVSIYAKLAWFEGMYHRELGEWEAAEEQLNRAVLFFGVSGDLDSVHRVVISLAELYVRADNVTDALEAVTNLLDHLSERNEPQLYWIARFNYAGYLVEADLYQTAQHELRTCLSSSGFPRDDFMNLRIQWLEGRIDRELGDVVSAEQKLAAVRAGYLAEGSGVNMALASLDLALVYLAQGRIADLKGVAEELALIFEANDIHREALAALMLFQEAVRQERVTSAYLGRLHKYLERSRNRPDLVFETPS